MTGADGATSRMSLLAPTTRPGRIRLLDTRAAGIRRTANWLLYAGLPVTAIVAVAAFLRFWRLTAVGFNSDEAVYSGTAASIAGNETLRSMFPIFRSHPLLLQIVLSFGMHGHVSEWGARAVTAAIGVATVLLTYALASRLYGHRAGLIAALLLAAMPYSVIVSRQVLLDGALTLLATLSLYCVVRYCESAALSWLLAASATMGSAVLTKETSIVLIGGLYAFFALTPAVRLRLHHVALATVVMLLVIFAFPLTLSLAGRSDSGHRYLLWQLFRRANHGTLFYFHVLPGAIGWTALAAASVGFLWLYRENTWRERLLICWIAVPIVFFTAWPVKGFQYLEPIAPIIAVLAGRTISSVAQLRPLAGRRAVAFMGVTLVTLAVSLPLAMNSWSRTNPSTSRTFLAGTGGVPGGREAGFWLRDHVPADAQLLAVGPSIANILQFYSHRRVFALSVSPTPANRNPAYVPVPNPDLALRQGHFHYLVWDSYTADRSPAFAAKLAQLINRYHGVAVFTQTVTVHSRANAAAPEPVVIVYQVRP